VCKAFDARASDFFETETAALSPEPPVRNRN
jgi:hypothetical protein